MLLILKTPLDEERLARLRRHLAEAGFDSEIIDSGGFSLLLIQGDTAGLDTDMLLASGVVADIKRLDAPYKLASRQYHPADTVVKAGGVSIGGGGLCLIAGPCTVENEQQLITIASSVKAGGAGLLRGGAFKPRTSPYSFQGLGEEGLKLLVHAKEITGLPVVSEIMDSSQLPLFSDIDIIQVGARNMQNFSLLKALGRQEKPVLLKRGPGATYEELLLSAEYLLSWGNANVILCERGVRSLGRRNSLDIAAIPLLRALTHLPVLADPSHGAGSSDLVFPLAAAAVAAGADGLLVEVHNAPETALCDGQQAVTPEVFKEAAAKWQAIHDLVSER